MVKFIYILFYHNALKKPIIFYKLYLLDDPFLDHKKIKGRFAPAKKTVKGNFRIKMSFAKTNNIKNTKNKESYGVFSVKKLYHTTQHAGNTAWENAHISKVV